MKSAVYSPCSFVLDLAAELLGVSTGAVPDDAFSATSSLTELSGPQRGRALVKEKGTFTGMALFDHI